MFTHYKTNDNIQVAVRLFDTAFAPVAGVAQASTTVTLAKTPAMTPTTLTAGTQYTWTELTTGAFATQGVYKLLIVSSQISTPGEYTIAITGGTGKAVTQFSVHDNYVSDVQTRLGTPNYTSIVGDIANVKTVLGTPSGSSVSADIGTVNTKLGTPVSSVSTDIAAVQTKLGSPQLGNVSLDIAKTITESTLARKMLANKATQGGNQFKVYDDDGVTVIKTYTTKDNSGNPTNSSIYQRIPE
jgi:hypothetical protein